MKLLRFAAPLVLLGALAVLVVRGGLLRSLASGAPPIEEITFDRVTLRSGEIVLRIVNTGPDPVTVAQVVVNEAFWRHTIEPERTLGRLDRATIAIPYPWVEAEPIELTLVTSLGTTFHHMIAVPIATPVPTARTFGMFALVGLFVGVIPVAIGLLWYPFLRQVDRKWIHFALALTAGLLVFLAVDSLHEALESAERVGGAFQGIGLVAVGVLGALLLLEAVGEQRGPAEGAAGRARLAYLIALGIGLHNFGEGLAIGAAYAVGEVALGAFLVVGFMLHNTTEGLGIVAPVAKDAPSLGTLARLGALAGGPTILGAWLGGFAYSPIFTTLAFAVGAGAIVQVILVLIRVLRRDAGAAVLQPLNAVGVLTGLLVMYGTGLFVAA